MNPVEPSNPLTSVLDNSEALQLALDRRRESTKALLSKLSGLDRKKGDDKQEALEEKCVQLLKEVGFAACSKSEYGLV